MAAGPVHELAHNLSSPIIETLRQFVQPRRFEKLARVAASRVTHVSLAFENLQDPLNGAACMRTADAFGVGFAHAIQRYAAFETHARISQAGGSNYNRTSSGVGRYIKVRHYNDTAEFLQQHSDSKRPQIVVLDMDGAIDLRDLQLLAGRNPLASDASKTPEPTEAIIVFGNETRGVSKAMQQEATLSVRIPMGGLAESLNLSVACGVVVWHLLSSSQLVPRCTDADREKRIALLEQWLMRDVKSSKIVLKRHGIAVDDF